MANRDRLDVIQELVAFTVDELSGYHRNPRRGDVDAIAQSLEVNGQYRPIVVNLGTHTGRPLEVLAGNHTLAGAKRLGWATILATTVDVDDLAAARIVAADNRTADLGDYDRDVLADLLAGLDDLAGTGYDAAFLEGLLAPEPASLTPEDAVPEKPADPRSKRGDVWRLGPHRLLCGDSTDTAAVRHMLESGGLVPDVLWTDPPYGISYEGGTKDKLTIQNDVGGDPLRQLLLGAFATAVAVCKPGAPVYVAHAETTRVIFETCLVEAGILFRQNLVWVKNSLVLGHSDYQYQHEPILYGETAAGDEPFVPRHEPILYGFTEGGKGRLGRGGVGWFGDNRQTTVFEVPKPARNGEHPTMKPTELIRQQLTNSLPPGGVVLDLFAGSGSTLIAAHHLKGKAALVELDPKYVDVICRRWQEHTGVIPVLDSTGAQVSFV